MDYQSGWTVLSLMFTFKQQSFLVGPSLAIVLITVRMAAAVCSASTIGKKAVKKDNLHGGGGAPVHQTQDPIIQNVGYI